MILPEPIHNYSVHFFLKDSVLFVLFVLFFRLFGIYLQLRRQASGSGVKLPGPIAVPLIGSAYLFAGASTTVIYDRCVRLFERYGRDGPFQFWAGTNRLVVLTKPEDLRVLYNCQKALEKERHVYRHLDSWFGESSLISAPVSTWRPHRRILTMTFNQTILDGYVDVFAASSARLVGKLGAAGANGQLLEIYTELSVNSLRTLCGSIMGVAGRENAMLRYIHASRRQAQIAYLKMFHFWNHYESVYKRTALAEDERKQTQILHDFAQMIYEQKLEERQRGGVEEEFGVTIRRKPFLNLLMDLEEKPGKYSKEEILDEINIFLGAGTETTTITSCFVLLMLAIHRPVQLRVYEEIRAIFGTSRRTITACDLRHLPYLLMVIKETLRLFPPVPLVARHLHADLRLPSTTIPAGSTCIAAPLAVHRDPHVWREPHLFDPDRFLPQERKRSRSYSFIPFSGGLRNCIGRKFAYMAVEVVVASIIREFEVHTEARIEDIELKIEITLKSVNGYPIRFVPRPD